MKRSYLLLLLICLSANRTVLGAASFETGSMRSVAYPVGDEKASGSAGGKESSIYTLDDLQKLAQENNPTLVQAKAQISGEKGKALQAGLPPNPALSYLGDLIGERRAGLGEWEGGIVSQEFILGGKLKYSRQKYLERMNAAEQQALAQQFRVANDVRIYFCHVVGAQEILKLQQELMNSAKDFWLTTHEMFNLGQANQASLHEANIQLEKQKVRVMAAENDLALAWQQLSTVVGVDSKYRTLLGTLDDTIAEISWDEALARLLQESPELGEAKDKLKSDEITVLRERRQPIPNLVVAGGAGYDQLDKSFAARAAVSITNIPVLNRNQGTIAQAKADLERQRSQVKLVELNLRRSLAEEYRQYKTALQYIKAYKDVIVPESRSRYEICLESYKDTRLDWMSVLEAQKQFVDAKIEYINHLVEGYSSAVQIQGFLLTGGLIAPPGVTPSGHIDADAQPR